MGAPEMEQFLNHRLSNVATSTQNTALAALLFFYRDVLKIKLERIESIERARRLMSTFILDLICTPPERQARRRRRKGNL